MSIDPLTASATIRNPQTFNRYSYALNSPYKFTDPLGLIAQQAVANGGCCKGKKRPSRPIQKRQTPPRKGLEPNKNVVVPQNVKDMANEGTTSGWVTPPGESESKDVDVILPDSMIKLKKELANFVYTNQGAASSQQFANSRTSNVSPNQGTVSNSTTETQGTQNSITDEGKLTIAKDPEVNLGRTTGTVTNQGQQNQAGVQLSGPSTDITGTLNNIENQTNLAIGNYLNQMTNSNGEITFEVIHLEGNSGEGTVGTADFPRSDVESYLRSFVQNVRNQATHDFNPDLGGQPR
jgi:hypothetical protein